MINLRVSRRFAALAIALLALVGLSLASASQLSLDGGTLQAGVAGVGSCQGATPIDVGFATHFHSGAYYASEVELSGVDAACDGLNYQLQLVDGGGAPIQSTFSGHVSLSGGGFSVNLPGNIPAASVASVALVITD